MRRTFMLLAAVLFATNVAVGCSTHRTVKQEETVQYPSSETSIRTDANGQVIERRTTTDTEEHKHHGVLSDTARLIGNVIAYPFRLVGDVVSAAF